MEWCLMGPTSEYHCGTHLRFEGSAALLFRSMHQLKNNSIVIGKKGAMEIQGTRRRKTRCNTNRSVHSLVCLF